MRRLLWIGAAALVVGWLLWGNSALQVTRYQIVHPDLPAGFDGFRIAQISDLHNAEFGRGNETLLSRLREAGPDVIFLTGDLIDCRRTNREISLAFAGEAVQIAPCYYVTGNHEARLSEYPAFLQALTDVGVTVLRNETALLERNGDSITLMGVDDPVIATGTIDGNDKKALTEALTELTKTDHGFTVLLSHRPEWFSLYREHGISLTFSGHAHGGQVRLPFVGGLIAPNQWFFPEYDAGVFTQGESTMVVSRGLGASIVPLRVNNRPELVVAELHGEE